MYPRRGEGIDWHLFMKSFLYESWIGISVMSISILVIVGCLILSVKLHGIEYDFGVPSLAAHLFCSHLCLGSPQEPSNISSRMMFFIISLGGYFYFALYTSYLGAFLSIPNFRAPVNGLKDVISSDYKLAVSKGSSVEKYFTDSERGSIQHQLLSHGKIISRGNETVAAKLMIEASLMKANSEKFLVFGVYQPLTMMPEYPCQLASVPVDYRKIGNGLIFQKDWPYKRLFNNHLNEVFTN